MASVPTPYRVVRALKADVSNADAVSRFCRSMLVRAGAETTATLAGDRSRRVGRSRPALPVALLPPGHRPRGNGFGLAMLWRHWTASNVSRNGSPAGPISIRNGTIPR